MKRPWKRLRPARLKGIVLVAAGALILGACGGGDHDDAGAAADSAGSATPAGAPIELGLVNTENSPAGSYAGNRLGVEAAVRYVNDELGGVNGRPLDVEKCITNASPESSIACANKFIQDGRLAVIPGIELGASAGVPLYAQAGVPYVGGLFTSPEEYTGSTSYSFIGAAPAAVTGIAAYAVQEMNAKTISIAGPDIPQLGAAVDSFMRPVFANLGVSDVTVVADSATAPDLTPAMTRANKGDPDVIIVLFPGPSCTKAMQGVAQANIPRDKVIYGQECASEEQISAGGGGGDGAIFQSAFLNTDGDSPNAELFREKLEQYADDAAPGVSTATGFDTVMNLYNVLKTITGDITRESLTAALKATNETPAFLSNGFTCDGEQFPSLPGLCDTSVRFYKYDNGEFVETNDQWVDGPAVLVGN